MGLTDQCEFITDMTHLKQHTHTLCSHCHGLSVSDAQNTHTHTHIFLCGYENVCVCAHTRALQPVHPFSFVFVGLYFSIPVPGSPADILLYTVSALSRPVGPIAPSELGYSVSAGQFQYVTSMSAHTHTVHPVETYMTATSR